MSVTKEKLHTILSNPLSPNIVTSLLETVEAAGALRGFLLHSKSADLFDQVFNLYELWHSNVLAGNEYSLTELLVRISSNNSKNAIGKQFQILAICEQYLHEKMSKYGLFLRQTSSKSLNASKSREAIF